MELGKMLFGSTICRKDVIARMQKFVFLVICFLSCVDMRLFVYSSLSKTLLPSIVIMLFSSISFLTLVRSKDKIIYSPAVVFLYAWLVFLCVHAATIGAEQYKLLNLLSSIILSISVFVSLKTNILERKDLERGLLLIGIIHVLYILLQSVHLISSYSAHFPLTGSNENPSITAIYLCGVVPLVIHKARHKLIYRLFFFVLLLSVVVLKCRTSYIGLVIIGFVCLVSDNKIINNFIKKSLQIKSLLIVCFVLIGFVASLSLYNLKKDSADSRVLIWKLSSEMIAEQPMGRGIGLFEKEYNKTQAEYFLANKGNDVERQNASFTAMAYNDYLEQGVEAGAIGMLFLVAYFVFVIFRSYKTKDNESLAVVSAFSVMSLSNFIYTSMQPWLLVMVYTGIILAKDSGRVCSKRLERTICCVSVVFVLCLAIRLSMMAYGQKQLASYKTYIESGIDVSEERFERLIPYVATSELYWRVRAFNYQNSNNFKDAATALGNACRYSYSPDILYNYYLCYKNMGYENKGIKYIEQICGIQPSRLTPKFVMMTYYKDKDIKTARKYANDILAVSPKIITKESQYIQQSAIQYLHEK